MKEAEESLGQEEKREVLLDEDGNPLSKAEALLQDKEYLATREEIRKLQPMRIGVFKRYWDKFKFNKTRRQYLIELFDETDKQIEFYLGDEYKNWRDELPGTRQFLKELETKKRETDILTQNKGNTIIRTIKGAHAELNYQEIEYSPKTFNPFDRLNIKTQEGNIQKVYLEKDNVGDDSSDEGLTIGTTATDTVETTSEFSGSDGEKTEGKQDQSEKEKQKL